MDKDLQNRLIHDTETRQNLSGLLASIHNRLGGGSPDVQLFEPSQASQFISLVSTGIGAVILESLLFTEAETVHKATVTAAKIADLKARGKSDEIGSALQQLPDDVTETYRRRLASVYGDIDVRSVVLEAVEAVTGVFEPKS